MISPHPDTDENATVPERAGFVSRIARSLDDPVLRALVASTAVSRIGRGVFLAVTVLFFTQIIGLSGGEAAVVLAVSSGCGAAGLPAWVAIVVLIAGTITHTFAEILSQAGAWGLSFELADPVRAGAYQGVFGMGFSLGALASPIVVNATAITFGLAGWIALGAIFLAAASGIWLIARRAAAPSSAAESASA